MAVSSLPFHNLPAQALQGSVNYRASGGDTMKMALFSTSPSLTTTLYSSLTGEISGTGYTTGGLALTSLTVTETEANSWGTVFSATTWAAGSVVIPSVANGFLYVTPNGGASSGSPTFPTIVGETVTDSGGVIWANIGSSITVFSSAAVSWPTSTITASYAVIYDSATSVNLVKIDFGGSQSDSNGTFTVSPPASPLGWFWAAGN